MWVQVCHNVITISGSCNRGMSKIEDCHGDAVQVEDELRLTAAIGLPVFNVFWNPIHFGIRYAHMLASRTILNSI